MASRLTDRELEAPLTGGDAELSFVLQWESEPVGTTAADVTWGALTLYVSGEPIWGSSDSGIRWTWVELLEFLADVWSVLWIEEGFPEGVGPGDPVVRLRHFSDSTRLASDAGLRTSSFGWDPDEIQEFIEGHDLASAVAGLTLPPLWIVRDGASFWLCSSRMTLSALVEDIEVALEELGHVIAERLGQFEHDERSSAVLSRWADRKVVQLDDFIALSTGLDEECRRELERDMGPALWDLDLSREDWRQTEVLAIARMASSASTFDLTKILDLVRSEPLRSTPVLDSIASQIGDAITAGLRPFESGYALAGALREYLGLSNSDRVEPEQLLADWGVAVRGMVLEESALDAIACWGPRHGPVVIVNRNGIHSSTRAGRRATLAHEIGHLLGDRRQWLPLAEVSGGRVTDELEQKARAFAAELLLPRSEAARWFKDGHHPPRQAVRALAIEFGVSNEIVAWQARNSDTILHEVHWRYLKGLVSQPSAY